MSYFTYHGKLGDELIVAVLPNGTVQADDPVYIYTDKKAMPYAVRYTSVTKDGDDKFTFHDGYYEFEAVATKAYQSLSLNRKTITTGKTATVVLTRQYSQTQTVTPQSNSPKIWTGTINFHSWAKEEPFVIVAPKGLGNEKPIVAIWQWTKDNKGTPNTLSYSTEKQTSKPASPTKFSFKQAGHYDVACQVNLATKGLAVIVDDATNDAVPQKELTLLPLDTLNAEYRFNPPRDVVAKRSLDCSLPNAKPALPRIAEPLPFPEDLVDCLAHVAAYVDRAGYHAKFSQKQFDKLDRALHLSEERVEKRDASIMKLKGDVARLETEKKDLKNRNDALDKKILEERKEAAAREDKLQEQLQKALEDLRASQGREKKLQKENNDLRDYIKRDAAMDAERKRQWEEWKKKDAEEDARREKEWRDHDKADEDALKRVQKDLMEARAYGKRLSKDIIAKDKKIADLESSLEATKCDLESARAEVDRLNLELVTELAFKVELQQELETAKEKLKCAEKDLVHLRQEVANLTESLAVEKKARAVAEEKFENEKKSKIELETQLENEKKCRAAAEEKLIEVQGKLTEALADVDEKEGSIRELNSDIKDLREQLKESEDVRKELGESYDRTRQGRDTALDKNTKLTELHALLDKEVKQLKQEIGKLKDHDKTHTHIAPVADKDSVKVSSTEIVLPS